MSTIRDGWTDDMNITIPSGHPIEEIVEFIIAAEMRKQAGELTETELVQTFFLSPEDAVLAIDRVCGGVVRAATQNEANRPDKTKDPLAYHSYNRAALDPTIITTIYPEYAPIGPADKAEMNVEKAWWQFWK